MSTFSCLQSPYFNEKMSEINFGEPYRTSGKKSNVLTFIKTLQMKRSNVFNFYKDISNEHIRVRCEFLTQSHTFEIVSTSNINKIAAPKKQNLCTSL